MIAASRKGGRNLRAWSATVNTAMPGTGKSFYRRARFSVRYALPDKGRAQNPLSAVRCRRRPARPCGNECLEAGPGDGGAHLRHQRLVIMDIAPAHQHRSQHLSRLDEMMEIGARIIARGRTGAVRIERTLVGRMPRILEIDLAISREGKTVASVPRRHHAIEHVDAARNG